MKRTLLIIAVSLAVIAGCAAPSAVLRTTQFEQVQIVNDEALVNRLFDDRAASNMALMVSLDVSLEQAIRARANPTADWLLETIKGTEAMKQAIRIRMATDEKNRATILSNLAARTDVLKKAETLIVKTQTWNSETQALVADLLSKTLSTVGGAP